MNINARCVKEFLKKGWSDEEAMKEYKENFEIEENPRIVCDDCFNKMKEQIPLPLK